MDDIDILDLNSECVGVEGFCCLGVFGWMYGWGEGEIWWVC